MRRMSGLAKNRHLDRTIAILPDDLDLTDCPIWVVGALEYRDGDADIGEIVGNIPGAEFRIEPGAVPAMEGVVDVNVPARQFRLQPACLIGGLDLGDGSDRNILDDEMRR